jgi:hypothetical protein
VQDGGEIGVDCLDVQGDGESCLPNTVEAIRPETDEVVASFAQPLCWQGRLIWHAFG